jgi:predicted SprT family Zn-dependent metalloprotease
MGNEFKIILNSILRVPLASPFLKRYVFRGRYFSYTCSGGQYLCTTIVYAINKHQSKYGKLDCKERIACAVHKITSVNGHLCLITWF